MLSILKKKLFLLPLVAFFLAGGAIAAQRNSTASLISIPVSLPPPYPCEQVGTCTLGGVTLCKTPSGIVLVEYFPVPGICGGPVYGIFDF